MTSLFSMRHTRGGQEEPPERRGPRGATGPPAGCPGIGSDVVRQRQPLACAGGGGEPPAAERAEPQPFLENPQHRLHDPLPRAVARGPRRRAPLGRHRLADRVVGSAFHHPRSAAFLQALCDEGTTGTGRRLTPIHLPRLRPPAAARGDPLPQVRPDRDPPGGQAVGRVAAHATASQAQSAGRARPGGVHVGHGKHSPRSSAAARCAGATTRRPSPTAASAAKPSRSNSS